ncbi:MAG: hypothetical protein EOO88_44355 [Pedobacter sp.]|nr:MAG: hypothetical protein EOO88_44355 [Pedobacter sp.]
MEDQQKTENEIRIAKGDSDASENVTNFGEPSTYTCPECHGVLFSIRDGNLKRYRCHTGHAYSPDTLLSSLSESIDDTLWGVIRGIQESIMLLNESGDHFAELNEPRLAAQYFEKSKKLSLRVQVLKDMITVSEHLSRKEIEG